VPEPPARMIPTRLLIFWFALKKNHYLRGAGQLASKNEQSTKNMLFVDKSFCAFVLKKSTMLNLNSKDNELEKL
jgi:hypothetical protein